MAVGAHLTAIGGDLTAMAVQWQLESIQWVLDGIAPYDRGDCMVVVEPLYTHKEPKLNHQSLFTNLDSRKGNATPTSNIPGWAEIVITQAILLLDCRNLHFLRRLSSAGPQWGPAHS